MKTAMILSAGRGERLRPLTDRTPKPLLMAGRYRLIEWHLHQLKRLGIERVIINIFWLAEQFEPALGNGERYGLEIIYVREPTLLNTAGGIIHALPQLGSAPFLLVNGDIRTEYPFDAPPLPDTADGALILVPNPSHNAQGDFSLLGNQVITQTTESYTYAGIAQFRPSVFASMPVSPLPLRPVLNQLIAAGRLHGYLYTGPWTDVGTPERLKAVQ